MTDYVSCDLGSSFAKASDGQRPVRFPSILMRGRPGCGIGIDGSWHIVGQDAIDAQANPDTAPQAIAQYHGSDAQRVILCDALRRMGYGDGRALRLLVLGLPFGMHRDEAICQRVYAMCHKLQWQQAEGARKVTPAQVRIVPQGFGSLRAFAENFPEVVKPGRLIAVADIGGQTTDIMMLEVGEGGAPRLIGGCSRSIGINVLEFYSALVRDLQDPACNGHVLRRTYHFHDLMERIRSGRTTLSDGPGGAQQDITDNIERVLRRWTGELQSGVRRVMGSRWSDLSAMVLTGGGAALLREDMWDGPVCKMGDMSNVEGQILALQDERAIERTSADV